MIRPWGISLRYTAIMILLFGSGFAQGASHVLIWPIDPFLASDARATELWIQNQGSTPATMQVRVVGWQQQQGHERYLQQDDVVASPPIVRINSNSKQLIRLIKQTPVPAGKELAYRVVVDEIPEPADSSKPQMGLKLQMRYSIPLFTYGAGIPIDKAGSNHANAEPEKLSWRVIKDEGKPVLQIRNLGHVHVRLSHVTISRGSLRYQLADGLMGYVLPQSERVWALPASLSQPTALSATINAQRDVWQSAPAD